MIRRLVEESVRLKFYEKLEGFTVFGKVVYEFEGFFVDSRDCFVSKINCFIYDKKDRMMVNFLLDERNYFWKDRGKSLTNGIFVDSIGSAATAGISWLKDEMKNYKHKIS
ncbi:MAG: hypothetical protein ABSG25_15180 [Bryobacteraceae bacterium]